MGEKTILGLANGKRFSISALRQRIWAKEAAFNKVFWTWARILTSGGGEEV